MIIKILEDTPNSGHEKEHLTLLLSNIQEKIQELGLPRGSLAIGVGNDIKFAIAVFTVLLFTVPCFVTKS